MTKIYLRTELQADEIYNRLDSITEKFHSGSNNKFLFEGKVSKSGFKILQTFDYGARNQLRPEIIGSIKSKDSFSVVELEFSLPQSLKMLFLITLIVSVGFSVFLYLKPIDNFITWKFFLLFIVATFLIFYLNFKIKTKSVIKVICKNLEAKMSSL